jgi:hypothetical protein
MSNGNHIRTGSTKSLATDTAVKILQSCCTEYPLPSTGCSLKSKSHGCCFISWSICVADLNYVSEKLSPDAMHVAGGLLCQHRMHCCPTLHDADAQLQSPRHSKQRGQQSSHGLSRIDAKILITRLLRRSNVQVLWTEDCGGYRSIGRRR